MRESEDIMIEDDDLTSMLKLTSIMFVIFLSIVVYASKSSHPPLQNVQDVQSLRSETSSLSTLSPVLAVVFVYLLFI